MKTLKIKTPILFNSDIGKNTILWCYFFFFLNPAVITQIFIVAAELAVHTGIPTKEGRAEIKTHSVTLELKINKSSV